MKQILQALGLLAGVAAFAAGAAPARADLLSTLLGGGSLTNGDLVFDQFTYKNTGDMPLAGGVTVTIVMDAAHNLGLEFQGGFVDLPGGGPSDALIGYRVRSLRGATITDAHIAGNPAVVGGTGLLSVTDTFLPDATNTMSIFDIGGGASKLTDATVFATPHQVLHVQKDIIGLAGTGAPTLSFVDQTYSQTAVPEPASLTLVGLGAAGLTGYAWRRRRVKA